MAPEPDPQQEEAPDQQERWQVLGQLEESLERPMLVLSFIWLTLVLLELAWKTSGIFELLGTIIWVIFILEFFCALRSHRANGRSCGAIRSR